MSATATTSGLKIAQRVVAALDDERRNLEQAQELYANRSDVPPDVRAQLPGWASSRFVLSQWRERGRQALLIHQGLVAEIRLSTSTKIVPEVFRTLPYLDPLVVFPEPPELRPHTSGDTLRVLGFFCHSRTADDGKASSTHDPDAVTFCAYALVEVTTPAGEVYIECDNISFPMDGEPFTLGEAVDRLVGTFRWETISKQDDTQAKRFMRDLSRVVIGSVMYLASTTLEAERVPRKAVLKALSSGSRPPMSAYRVGWTIGAALSASRKTVGRDTPTIQSEGREQEPQHRRAHFKTVWTGEGSMVPKTVFIAPYWTHLEKLGAQGVNVARPVKA